MEVEESLITPYYIQGNKRMELYQYEFCCTDESDGLTDFLKFLLDNKTLKEEIKKVFGHYSVENLYAVVY